MKKYIYGFGTVALALAMSGLPAAALADSNSGDGQGGLKIHAEVTAQAQGGDASTNASTSASARAGEGQKPSVTGSEEGSEASQSSSAEAEQHANEQAREGAQHEAEKTLEAMKEGLPFSLESTTTAALSFEQLKQSIEMRQQELDQEEASSSPETRNIMKNANPVRLAVHSFLASKDLLGGIGQQVSVIAQQVNDSVASTTNAEAQIESRGFLAKLFFGGDAKAAAVIQEQVAQNQQRIDDLTKLLAQANVAADIQVTLKAQIAALQEAQARLQVLAEQQQHMWGLFSWRF